MFNGYCHDSLGKEKGFKLFISIGFQEGLETHKRCLLSGYFLCTFHPEQNHHTMTLVYEVYDLRTAQHRTGSFLHLNIALMAADLLVLNVHTPLSSFAIVHSSMYPWHRCCK